MAVTVPVLAWKQFFRVAPESAFNTNTATADWNIGGNGGGATGWRDMAIIPGAVRLNPNVNNVFQEYASGKRPMHQQAPVEGAYTVDGSFEMPLYLELVDPFLEALMGSVTRTPTAGAAAKSSVAWASLATLDTQPNGTEQLKFVISSSTGSTGGAAINIIQNAATVETITIGNSGSSVDGDYYSKGAYDGSSNAITFTVTGTVTSGTVVVSGVDLNTNVFTLGTTAPSTLKIEEGGQPRGVTNSNFYNGVVVPTMTFAFDRAAADGMVTVTADVATRFPAATTAGTYANDAKTYYHPLQGWTASVTKGGAAFEKLAAVSFTISNQNNLFAIASGNQQPSGALAGSAQVTGTFSIFPEDTTEWDDYIAQTVGDWHLTFTSPQNIVDSTKWSLLFEFSELYIENYTETVDDQIFGADLEFKTTDDASDGIVKITSVCRMPV